MEHIFTAIWAVPFFDDYHRTNARNGHLAIACKDARELVAVADCTPKEMTDCRWELLMIMVDSGCQRRGIGGCLLQAVEDERRAANGRILLIETSSLLSVTVWEGTTFSGQGEPPQRLRRDPFERGLHRRPGMEPACPPGSRPLHSSGAT